MKQDFNNDMFFCVFMIATHNPAGRVHGPTGREKSHAASEGTSAAPPLRKPEIGTTQ